MPRYLNPVKITLLNLVHLYIAGEMPSKAKLEVLAFLASQINPSPNDTSVVGTQTKLLSADDTFLSTTLSQLECRIPDRTLYDRLLKQLWELDDLDGIFVLFKSLSGLVAHPATQSDEEPGPKLSRASLLGLFIRRCCYEFERLHFADVQKLYNAFVSYRAPSYQTWADKIPEVARRNDFNRNITPSVFAASDSVLTEYTSTQDIDNILNLSLQQLQKLGNRVPSGIKLKLRECFEAQHDANAQSLQYFLAFFEHWRAAQMSMALESLHQYFDYSVGVNRGSENLKVYFQYAQLHQSVLYADFECWEESVNAMSECIATGMSSSLILLHHTRYYTLPP